MWDVTPQHRSPLQRVLGSWRLSVAVLLAVASVAVLVIPLGIAGVRFVGRLRHPLQKLAEDAQPASATVFDRGVESDDPNGTGFAFGISPLAPAVLLEQPPPGPWRAAPELGNTADSRQYRHGHLLLTIRVDRCGLQRCRPGDSLVYTEVMGIS